MDHYQRFTENAELELKTMPESRTYRVFVSYTGQDLAPHADVAAKVLRALQHLAIDHRNSGATGQPSVQWCMDEVDKADFLIVLVAHRYGWVPSIDLGGDGRMSITEMEVKRAKERGKIVLPYIVEDDSAWPTGQIEALTNPRILEDLNRFKSELRQTVAASFTNPASLDGPLSRDIPKAIARIQSAIRTPSTIGKEPKEHQPATPWLYDPDDPPSPNERMTAGFPKRILSIQGGSVQAAVTLGYLERIERLLQVRYGDPNFLLSNYFDLIGGLGLSSLLAIELARRRSVTEAAATFKYVLERGFKKKFLSFGPFPYDDKALRRTLLECFGNARLDDAKMATGIALITTSLESARPVIISNHPALMQKFGKDLNLADFALACLAKPGYVGPAFLIDARGHQQVLVAGETSVGPDPSLALMLLATSPSFPFRWRIGQHNLSVTSVGFQEQVISRSPDEFKGSGFDKTLKLIIRVLDSLNVGAAYQSRMVLEALAIEGPTAEAGLLEQSAAVTYRSYENSLNTGDQAKPPLKVEFFDHFLGIGRAAADHAVEISHFPETFDVRVPIERSPARNSNP